MKQQRKQKKHQVQKQKPKKTPASEISRPESGNPQPELEQNGRLNELPNHPTSKSLQRDSILHLQRRHGNAYVQRFLTSRQNRIGQQAGASLQKPMGKEEESAAEQKPASSQATASANGNAHESVAAGKQEANGSNQDERRNDQATEPVKQAGTKVASPAKKNGKVPVKAKDAAGGDRQGKTAPAGGEQEAQTRTGTAAEGQQEADGVSQSVDGAGSGEKAPTSPEEDPGFQEAREQSRGIAEQQQSHEPAGRHASQAQAAVESPTSEREARAQNLQVGEMQQAETPAFNAASFKARLMQRIQALAPRTAQEADNFKGSNKVGGLKNEMKGKVAEQKQQSQGPLKDKTSATPNSGKVPPKPVSPLQPIEAGPVPQLPSAVKAAPKKKGTSEIEEPIKESGKQLDQRMAEAEITEEQLARSNEPEFQSALDAKQEAKKNAQEAPKSYREAEQEQLSGAEAEAVATAEEKTQGMHGERSQILAEVATQQTQTKSSDEKARAEVASRIQGIYGQTRNNVEGLMADLDGQVNQAFDQGTDAAKRSFENFVDAKMGAYKERRYGGALGWAAWAKDKLLGMPSEVNAFYKQGRQLYLQQMDAVIDNVVSIISQTMAEAKTTIANGKQEIDDYLSGLPQELQEVGQQAAGEIQGRFNQLAQSIEDRQGELIERLADKYEENLGVVDARIEALKTSNQGLVQDALDTMSGVIGTIVNLKDKLISVVGKAVGAVKDIIKDPIRFLGNLIGGIKQGFQNFAGNIVTHLKKGLMSWLFGALAKAGIEMPESFDMKGILSLVTQVLGITWENIRARAVKLLGERVVGVLERQFEIFTILKEQGLGGLWGFIKDRLANLKEMIFDPIKEMLINQVIKGGIQWLMGVLGGPADAFVKAVTKIHEIVNWFISKGQKVASLVQAILSSITAIASGAVGQAATFIENAMAKAIPAVITFLADLLGLGDIAEKIKGVITKIKSPIEQAIDWVLKKAKGIAGNIAGLLGPGEEQEGT